VILEHVPVHTELEASRALDLAKRFGINEAARTLSLSRAAHLRGGNSALWLLKAGAGETLNRIALKYLDESVVRLNDEENENQQKRDDDDDKTCVDVLKDMHTLLSIENDIKMFGPSKLVIVEAGARSNLAREASKHLIGILSDDKLPARFAWPLLCMSMPYLRIRSFTSDMVSILMRHLEEMNKSNDSKPYVIRGSLSRDGNALNRWGLDSKRDQTLEISFVTTLRLELARNLSTSLLCPFG